MELSERDLDKLADKVTARVMKKIHEQYEIDLAWAHNERLKDQAYVNSKRRVLETVIGGAGTVGFIALIGWIGHVIVTTLIDLVKVGV